MMQRCCHSSDSFLLFTLTDFVLAGIHGHGLLVFIATKFYFQNVKVGRKTHNENESRS